MKEINEIISDNIKLFRKQHGYSLDHLSELTGVSKTMLGQIERKTSTPSITTLWKIASGLKVSFTELTQESDAIINKITLDQTQALSSEHNKYFLYLNLILKEKLKVLWLSLNQVEKLVYLLMVLAL